jgi:lysozyme
MKLDKKGYDLIRKHEGLRLKAYLCPAKVPTIGYGNTFYEDGKKVKIGDEITKERADQLFEFIADRFAQKVFKLTPANLTQNQFNALVSFAYNVGLGNYQNSTLLRKVLFNPNSKDVEIQFMRWTKANGVELRGLINRRKDEVKLYYS